MRKILVSVCLLGATMTSHAEKRSGWGIDIGSISTVNYSIFGEHFGVEASAGLLWKYFYGRDSGFTPIVAITPRFHFSRTTSAYRQRGFYIGLRAFGSFPRFDPRRLAVHYDSPDCIYQRWGVVPHLGWNIGLSTRSYINVWLGIAYAYKQFRNEDGEFYWSEDIRSNPPGSGSGFRPLEVSLSYNIRF